MKVIKKVQTSSYKISPGDVIFGMVAIVNNTVLYILKLLRVDIKSSHHKKKFVINYV